MAVPRKSTSNNFVRAERTAPVVAHQKTRRTENVAEVSKGTSRESRSQEGKTLSETFDKGTSSKPISHNLGREPEGWYVVDVDQFCYVRKIELPKKFSSRDMINIEVSGPPASETKIKIRVF